MHRLSANFVLGYHGSDKKAVDKLLTGEAFDASENDYDWLGPGIYFWEANPERAYSFAKERLKRLERSSAEADAVGAVIDPGLCLDLGTEAGVIEVSKAYETLLELCEQTDKQLPRNTGGSDSLLRNLDCAVLRAVHFLRKEAGQAPIDTVRGIFIEGEPVYPGAGFHHKTHVQICVCNPRQVKGVFRIPGV